MLQLFLFHQSNIVSSSMHQQSLSILGFAFVQLSVLICIECSHSHQSAVIVCADF
jgi:hypothetical protein